MITIGLRDLYDQLQRVSAQQVALTSKMDTMIIAQSSQMTGAIEDIKDHEHRLRAQEAKQTVSPRAMWSGAAVLLAAVGLVMTLIQLVQ
jgi:hypothetical protein